MNCIIFSGINYDEVMTFTKGNAYITCKGKDMKFFLISHKKKINLKTGDVISYVDGFYKVIKNFNVHANS